MKQHEHTASFRRKVTRYFLICVCLSAVLASLGSYLVSNAGVLEDMKDSEQAAAVYLLALEQKTDLNRDELAAMISSVTLDIDVTLADSAELSEEQQAELEERMMVTSGGGLTTLPTTYVMLSSVTLDIDVTLADSAELSEEQQAELEERMMVTSGGGLTTLPTTYVMLESGLMCITAKPSFNQLHMSILRFVFSIVFFCLALMIMGRVFSSKVASPVAQLRKATQRIAQGDFTVRLPVRGEDELSCLMQNFNDMVEALARNEYLQKDFISNVSHEFKTPIASIQGFARLLQSGTADAAAQREYIDIIAEESLRLSHLSQNLLRLSSLDHLPTAEAAPFALDEQLRRVVVQMEPAWAEKDIDWELDLSPTVMTGQSELLAEVWINLLNNAIKFSPTGGKIQISCYATDQAYVEITDQGCGMDEMTRKRIFERFYQGDTSHSKEGGKIQISCYATDQAYVEITDQGCGMDEMTRKRIFERFYQGDTSHSKEGSGLGLCIVKKIVTLSGGEIHVRSTPGRGSTFRVSLPLTPAPASLIPQEVK